MAKTDINEVEINGVKYTRKGSEGTPSVQVDGLDYVIVRCDRAGVFAGYLEEREGTEAILVNVRRLWYWSGAASLSQLAIDGTSKPGDCKFPAPVSKIVVTGVIEVISTTQKAKDSIEGVKEWSQ